MTVEEIKVQPREQPEDPAYIEAMVNKAEGKETTSEEEPRLLAGKYKNEEELTKGILEALKAQHEGKDLEAIYKILEAGIHNKKSSGEGAKEEETPASSPETTETTTSNTFDFSEYEEELLTTGELSEKSYEALAKKGFPKEVVDVYLAGQRAIAKQLEQEFYQIVGGEANYKAMTEWARVNLSESEIEAFNNTLKDGNPEMIKMATEALYFRYTKAKGSPPKELVQGISPSVSTQGDVYQSIAELTADMSDPRYEKDPAFRARVHQKLAKSNIL